MARSRRLQDQTVLVTRSWEQAQERARRLEAEGARALLFPTIAIRPPASPQALAEALKALDRYRWLVLTSPNGVEAVRRALEGMGRDGAALRRVQVAAVGPGTAEALRAWGVEPDLVPARFETEALAEALVDKGVAGAAVLIARSLLGSPELVRRLHEAGARVTEVEAYRVVPGGEERGLPPEKVREALDQGGIDWVTLTSPSTVTGLIQRLGTWQPAWSARTRVACIGPVTARRCRELGVPVDLEAPVSSVEGLVAALSQAAGRRRGSR